MMPRKEKLAALPLAAGAKAAPKFGGATVFIDGFEHGVLDVGDWDSGDFTLDFWTSKSSSKRWVSDLMLHWDGNSRQREKLIRELCRVVAQIEDRSPCADKQHHIAVVASK